MPYASTNELPDCVKDNLPSHAQDIYKETFNSAKAMRRGKLPLPFLAK
jgi:cation transport regulator ChaB